MKVKKDWLLVLFVGVLVLIVGVGLLVKPLVEKEGELARFPDRGVPRMNITLNGVSLDEIKAGSKETKYEGNELSLYEGDEMKEFGGVEVKGRGNSTWMQEKKPYQIKFSQKVDLLGMGKNKKWVLLANYLDKSLIRNDVAMLLAEMLETEYNVKGRFVEVYFNGEYEGLYYVLPKIEIAKGSVDLKEPDGVLFELDTLHRHAGGCYESYLKECLILKDTVTKEQDIAQVMAINFMEDFNDFEKAIKQGDYKKVTELIDINSFVRYFLVNEFTVNPDAYSSSFYLYKDGADSKIYAGPVWDFDLALGNRAWNWQVDEDFFSVEEEMVRKKEAFGLEGLNEDLVISKIFYYLEEMPRFRGELMLTFQGRLSGRKSEFIEKIRREVEKIRIAMVIDNEKWGIEKSETDLEELIEWVAKRYDFFEKVYGSNDDKENKLL